MANLSVLMLLVVLVVHVIMVKEAGDGGKIESSDA